MLQCRFFSVFFLSPVLCALFKLVVYIPRWNQSLSFLLCWMLTVPAKNIVYISQPSRLAFSMYKSLFGKKGKMERRKGLWILLCVAVRFGSTQLHAGITFFGNKIRDSEKLEENLSVRFGSVSRVIIIFPVCATHAKMEYKSAKK